MSSVWTVPKMTAAAATLIALAPHGNSPVQIFASISVMGLYMPLPMHCEQPDQYASVDFVLITAPAPLRWLDNCRAALQNRMLRRPAC